MIKKILKISTIIGLIFNISMANNSINSDIYEQIKNHKSRFKIKEDPRLIYTILDRYSDVQTNYTTLRIFQDFKAMLIKELKNLNVKYNEHDISKSWAFIKVYPKDKNEAMKVAKMLMDKGYLFKAGLAQIESKHLKESDLQNLYDVDYNIEKIIAYFDICSNTFKQKSDLLECVLQEARPTMSDMENKLGRPYYWSLQKRYKKTWNKNL
jgi:hypothetical protein